MNPGPYAVEGRRLRIMPQLSLPSSLCFRVPVLSPQTPLVFFSLTILFFSAPRASVCTAVACVENFGSILITELPVASLCLFLLHPLYWEFYNLFRRPLVSFVLKAGF